MSRSTYLQSVIRLSLCAGTLAVAMPVVAQEPKSSDVLGAVIVTAQKREESVQDVPIAVSAFSEQELTARGLDGGPQILQAIPNVTFSKQNFTSFNLQIRGVGSKLIAASGDQGVGIHLNNAPLAASRFFEAEFYDLERIEVLRGPQGTLYGRNATGGVFNAITAKPTKEFDAALSSEFGSYDTIKLKGMVNLPLGSMFQLRLAASALERDGYNKDLAHNTSVDGRDLYAARATLAFTPGDSFKGQFLWEHFREDDDRQRTGAQLCTKDPGPTRVLGQSTTTLAGGLQARWFMSQGCLPGSLYSGDAHGTLNSAGSLGGVFAAFLGMYGGDMYAGQTIPADLRYTGSYYRPVYFAASDVGELNLELKLNDQLTLTSLTSYNDDSVDSKQDYNRTVPNGTFNTAAPLSPVLFPGGFYNDPQIGRTNRLAVYDKSFIESTTWTQELRLQSAFDGPLNFNIGAIYLDQDSPDQGYYVFFNTGTAYAQCYNLGFCNNDPVTGANLGVPAVPMYIDPNVNPTGEGHNYYLNKQTFSLRSLAGFGELYWQMSDALKMTLGLRYTKDKKEADSYDFNHQFIYPGRGFTPQDINHQTADFNELTGRFGFDWKVSDNSLLYAFYSKGYKGGGFNSSTAGNVKTTFDPEFVNAFELGTKNTFADGRLQVNATGFLYNYDGYQISRIVNLTSVNDNIDAKIHGVELEVVAQPVEGMRLDANVGYLRTKISGNPMAIDVMNRTQGDANLTVIKGLNGTNCVAPSAAVATVLGAINAGLAPVTTIPSICPSANFPAGRFAQLNAANYLGFIITPSEGVAVNVGGNELPNAPRMTISLGAQQTFQLNNNWTSTFRADYYRQSESYTRIFNTEFDRLHTWQNVNLSLLFANDKLGTSVMFYVKNLADSDNITDVYLTDDSSGLFANSFLTDPRVFGVVFSWKH